jgi:hypothetical protein
MDSTVKNYVQYHNTATQGALGTPPDGGFRMFATKSIHHLVGQKVWLISGEGAKSPKSYYLRYWFNVEEIKEGTPNIAHGFSGHRFDTPIHLNAMPWFREFLRRQQNFSLGVREIQSEFIGKFEEALGR